MIFINLPKIFFEDMVFLFLSGIFRREMTDLPAFWGDGINISPGRSDSASVPGARGFLTDPLPVIIKAVLRPVRSLPVSLMPGIRKVTVKHKFLLWRRGTGGVSEVF